MKQSARLAELALRLNLNSEFQEFWAMVVEERDKYLKDAIHSTDGDPAEKRGAARAFDKFVTEFEDAPSKVKKLQSAMR